MLGQLHPGGMGVRDMAKGLIRAQRVKQAVRARTMRSDIVGRQVLLNREQVMRSARAKTGYQAKQGYDYYKGDYWEGVNLRKGVEGMAELVSPLLSDEELRKLRSMGSEELSALYQNNRFVFEVAFNYGGIEKGGKGAYSVSEQKAEDLRFLIKQYERYYGELRWRRGHRGSRCTVPISRRTTTANRHGSYSSQYHRAQASIGGIPSRISRTRSGTY